MKRFIFILFILLNFNTVFCQSKIEGHEAIDVVKLRCTYKFSYQSDSTDTSNIRSEDMVLMIGKTCSKFKSYNFIITDSLIENFERIGLSPEISMSQLLTYPKPRIFQQIFKNEPKGSISIFEWLYDDKFIYNEPMDIFKWKILPNTANISGYNCQKATTTFRGRNYEAWFTSEIPISDGPYKFNGLPGLIVKIADTKKHYVFELISAIKPPMGTLLYLPTYPTICTTRDGFRKAKKDAQQDMIQRLEDMGIHFPSTEERQKAKERAMTKARRTNNPIELK